MIFIFCVYVHNRSGNAALLSGAASPALCWTPPPDALRVQSQLLRRTETAAENHQNVRVIVFWSYSNMSLWLKFDQLSPYLSFFSFFFLFNPQLPSGCRGAGQTADGRRARGGVWSAGVWRRGGCRHYGMAASSCEEGTQTAAVEHGERCVCVCVHGWEWSSASVSCWINLTWEFDLSVSARQFMW